MFNKDKCIEKALKLIKEIGKKMHYDNSILVLGKEIKIIAEVARLLARYNKAYRNRKLNNIVCRGVSCIIDLYEDYLSEHICDKEEIIYEDLDMQKFQ